MNLVAEEYHKNNFFHGDIKPDNIFFIDKKDFSKTLITTDVGSILYLGEPNNLE
jgi:hypothetical protein